MPAYETPQAQKSLHIAQPVSGPGASQPVCQGRQLLPGRQPELSHHEHGNALLTVHTNGDEFACVGADR